MAKQVSLRLSDNVLEQIDEMVRFYGASSRNSYIISLVDDAYGRYQAVKQDYQSPAEMLVDIVQRLQCVEKRLDGIESMDSRPTESKSRKKAKEAVRQPENTPARAEVNRVIMEQIEAGLSLAEVADHLNAAGYRTSRGADWEKRLVHTRVKRIKEGKEAWGVSAPQAEN